ncbi:hypothetical protein DKK75_07995 [Bifidobacterium asteroides]|uniref:DUF805 domain-containing protein n=2 Tax=Bifidobacterium TaxID=1678 RepID=A0A318M2I1_9BIFI|nr:DUF805 domain-containing protein [Bifidobacterium asteroides]PXY81260.1 hypothetical protein DKK75_07995 [Bifidobacterium asteroides]
MTVALFENRPPRVPEMKGFEPMYDATFRECLQRPLYLFARGRGRSCRKEIWVFFIVLSIAEQGLSNVCGGGTWALIPLVFDLIMVVPEYALEVRRLHDLLLPGWLTLIPCGLMVIATIGLVKSRMLTIGGGPYLLAVIPLLVSTVIQLVIMCMPSRHHRPSFDNGAIDNGAIWAGVNQSGMTRPWND